MRLWLGELELPDNGKSPFGDYYIYTRIIKSTKLTNPFMFTIRLLTSSTNNMAMSKIVSICANKMEVGISNHEYEYD